MIHVIATIEVKEGRREEFLAEFHRLVPMVLAEEGCLEYGPTVDVAVGLAAQSPLRPNVVTVVEKWVGPEQLQNHLVAPHMLDYRIKVQDMLESLSLVVLEPA